MAKIFCDRPVFRKTSLHSTPDTKPSRSVSIWLKAKSDLAFSSIVTIQGFISFTIAKLGASGVFCVIREDGAQDIDEWRILKGNKLGGSWSGIWAPSLALFTNCKAFSILMLIKFSFFPFKQKKMKILQSKTRLGRADHLDLDQPTPKSLNKKIR